MPRENTTGLTTLAVQVQALAGAMQASIASLVSIQQQGIATTQELAAALTDMNERLARIEAKLGG